MSRALAIAACLAGAACDTRVHQTGNGGPPDASPSCTNAVDHSDLAWIEDNVFSRSCVFSSCHKGRATMAGHLSLEVGKSRDQLLKAAEMDVAKNDAAHGAWMRVVPGDPKNSYMMVLIDHEVFAGPLDSKVGTMPQNAGLLCQEKRDAIKRWIGNGAMPREGQADARVDAGPDAAVDAGADAGTEDAAFDAGADATVDAP